MLDPTQARGWNSSIACVVGAVLPGVGHAVVGQYLPRGLAFTTAIFATIAGGVTFLTHVDDSPRIRGQLLLGGILLLFTADVLYIWSVIDALMLASKAPPPTPRAGGQDDGRRGRVIRLGMP